MAIRQDHVLVISGDTAELIKAGESVNTLRAYRRALLELDKWLDAALKWQAKNMNCPDMVGAITQRALAGIRR